MSSVAEVKPLKSRNELSRNTRPALAAADPQSTGVDYILDIEHRVEDAIAQAKFWRERAEGLQRTIQDNTSFTGKNSRSMWTRRIDQTAFSILIGGSVVAASMTLGALMSALMIR